MKMIGRIHLVLAILLCLSEACSVSDQTVTERADVEKPVIYVVNYPLKYFAARIAGDLADVKFPAPAQGDPAIWKPDDAEIEAFQNADMILLNGAAYAKWTETVSLPPSKVLITSEEFRDQYISVEGAIVHTHGPEGGHSHGEIACTTWLDPGLADLQAKQIKDGLSGLLPDKSSVLAQNYQALSKDLLELDALFRKVMNGYSSQPLLASHPVYQYFARRYNLNLKSMHWEPTEIPSETRWLELTKLLEQHPARWMIWEAPPKEEIIEELTRLGVKSAVFFPCGNTHPDGDYLQVMKDNAERLRPVFLAP